MAAEKTPTYTNHDGYRLAKGFPLDGFHSGLKYEARDEDLFIVTYPKVRTHKLKVEECISFESGTCVDLPSAM